jgi:hypothetical protein
MRGWSKLSLSEQSGPAVGDDMCPGNVCGRGRRKEERKPSHV